MTTQIKPLTSVQLRALELAERIMPDTGKKMMTSWGDKNQVGLANMILTCMFDDHHTKEITEEQYQEYSDE